MSNQPKGIKQSKISLNTPPNCRSPQMPFSGPVILPLDPVIVLYFTELLKDILKTVKKASGTIDTSKAIKP